jgi:EmrB/QacA subfamily drug resistance transporter
MRLQRKETAMDIETKGAEGSIPRDAEATRSAALPRRTAILAIILVSYLMIVIDISIVITGLPKIQQGLGFSPTALSWVQNAYTLAFGGLLLLGARAGDILGRKRMFVLGLGVFTGASLLIGVAPSGGFLIAARALQGVGAAILAPSTLALLTASFPEGQERTRALAYYAAIAGVGASVGLVLGGIVADWLSWRVGFFINLPIGAALIFAAHRTLQETERRSGAFDLTGAITSTLGMTALVYGIVRAADFGWSDRLALSSIAAGVVLLGLLVLNEWRAAQPIMPLRLFASRERGAAYATRVLYLGGMLGFWFFTTQYMQGVFGFGPLLAGVGFLPTTIPNFAAAMAVPKLTKLLGNGRLLAAGLALTAVGMAWLSRASAASAYVTAVALPMVLIGIGQGAVLGPLTVSGVAGVSKEDAGAASGLVNVTHQLGGSLGLAILVVVFAASHTGAAPEQLARGVSAALSAATVMLVLALLIVLIFIVARPHPRAAEPQLADGR